MGDIRFGIQASVAEAWFLTRRPFQQLVKTPLDGSKYATVKPKWNLTTGIPFNAGSDRRNEFNLAKTESHSYRPRFLSYARVQRHSGRRQLDRAM